MKLKSRLRRRKPKEKYQKPEAPKHLQEESKIKTPNGVKIEQGKIPAIFEPKFIESCDGRHHIIKIIKKRQERLKTETGADSLAKEILCERASFLVAVIETNEVYAVEKGIFDSGSYVQSVNALTGLLKSLGLEIKGVKASLSDYVQQLDAKKQKKKKRKRKAQ